jgi:NAD(P)-dependent dehydrogenase (short-subunit alcohol dehydrogenase family)
VNQIFLPILKKPGGRIINISSESLHLNVPFMPYPISKMALEGYAKVLRQELKFSGIDVIIIRPGAIRTQLLKKVSLIRFPVTEPTLDKAFRKFAGSAPREIGKTLEPEVVAEFVYNVSQILKPKVIYKINNSKKLRIASLLPYAVIEKMITKKLKD